MKTRGQLQDDVLNVARGVVGDELGAPEHRRSSRRLGLGEVQRNFARGAVEVLEEGLRVGDDGAGRGGVDDCLGRSDREGRAAGYAGVDVVRSLELPALVGVEDGEVARGLDAHAGASLFDAIGRYGERDGRVLADRRVGRYGADAEELHSHCLSRLCSSLKNFVVVGLFFFFFLRARALFAAL